MCIAFFFLLPAAPLQTQPLCRIHWLDLFSARERHIMQTRVILDDPNKDAPTARLKPREILMALYDYRLWGHFAINILSLAPKGGLQLYSPSIIKSLNFSTTKANALSSVSNYGVCVLSLLVSWLSDWKKARGAWCIIACAWSMVFAGALYGLPTGADRWTRYAIFTLLNSGNGISQSLNDAWLSSNCRSHQTRSIGLALAVIGSNLGGLAGQQLFQDDDAPRYNHAFVAILCLYGASIVMIAVQMVIYALLNRKERLVRSGEGDDATGGGLGGGHQRYEL